MKINETHPREKGFVLRGHCQNILDDPRKVIITAGIDMACVIYGAEAVTIKKSVSLFKFWFNASFTDFDPICLK